MNALTQLLAQSDELQPERKKKCIVCGKVKFFKDFSKHKTKKYGIQTYCKACVSKKEAEYKSTELGYLKDRYKSIRDKTKKRCFSFDEFFAAWKKHKSIYGMKSAWGPGVNHLEQHLPITTITPGTKRANEKTPRIMSNLSADRLDSSKDYTIQNLIFIRNDENRRKNNTSYEDCKIQIRLHEERFGK